MIKVVSISPGPVLVFSIPTYWRGGVIERILMLISIMSMAPLLKVDLYDLVIFDHFWPSDWRGNRNEF